jgi:hypothetical protein
MRFKLSSRTWFLLALGVGLWLTTWIAAHLGPKAWATTVMEHVIIALLLPVGWMLLNWTYMEWAGGWMLFYWRRGRPGMIPDDRARELMGLPPWSEAFALTPEQATALANAAPQSGASPSPDLPMPYATYMPTPPKNLSRELPPYWRPGEAYSVASGRELHRLPDVQTDPTRPLPSDGDFLVHPWEISAWFYMVGQEAAERLNASGTRIATAHAELLEKGVRLAAAVVPAKIPAVLTTPADQMQYLVVAYLCKWYDVNTTFQLAAEAKAGGVEENELYTRVERFLSAYRWGADAPPAVNLCELPVLPHVAPPT